MRLSSEMNAAARSLIVHLAILISHSNSVSLSVSCSILCLFYTGAFSGCLVRGSLGKFAGATARGPLGPEISGIEQKLSCIFML